MKKYQLIVIYCMAGLAWISVSDQLSHPLARFFGADSLLSYQSAKGVLFVVFTSVVFFVLVRRHRKRLQLSEAQYRNLFAANPNVMLIYDATSLQFIEVNDAAAEMYGFSKAEFSQMLVTDILSGKEIDHPANFLKYPDRPDKPRYWHHKCRNGRQFIVSMKLHYVDFNDRDCIMAMVTDVTERVLQHEKLREVYAKELELNRLLEENLTRLKLSDDENRRLAEIINKINSLVMICDKNLVIQWVNHTFQHVTGYKKGEAIGKHPLELMKGPKTDERALFDYINSAEKADTFSTEIISYTKDGREYWSQVDVSPFRDEQGNIEGYISIGTVISDKKEREQEIEEKNTALRSVAWSSSHEIRRPVSSILSLISLLKSAHSKDELDEYLSLLERCSSELDEIVKNVAKKVNDAEN